MLSARNFLVLLAGCLATGSLVAQDAKPGPDSLPSQIDQAVSKPVPQQLGPEELGDIHMARKMYREAIESYEQAPQNSAVIWNKMGIAYHQMMQLDAAMKRYQRAMRLDSKYAEAVNNAGTIYYAEKRYGRAARYYKRALKLAPQAASIYSNLGTAYFAQKKYKDAVQAYDTALRLDPEVFEHRNSYGVLLQERAVDERAKFHYYLARAYAKEGQKDRAFEYIRKALEEGFTDRKKLMQDPEFAAYRDLPEFKELLRLEPRVL
ncbi:MAG TPA: tetratricopeptide repeat protein [Bryobacteraceae bacterium]|nr:tetratricopeptide repeat protein [Bryobacteraceae bacterium]